MSAWSIDSFEAAAKVIVPPGVFIHVNTVMDGSPQAGFVHIIVNTMLYSQSYIDPNMLNAADAAAHVFANHVEMNVLELREQLMKIVEAIDAR